MRTGNNHSNQYLSTLSEGKTFGHVFHFPLRISGYPKSFPKGKQKQKKEMM